MRCALLASLLPLAGVAAGQSPVDAAVRGRLVDGRGSPVSAAEVRLLAANDLAWPGGMHGNLSRTDRSGGFTVVGLAPGIYRADVLLPGSMAWLGAAELRVSAGEVEEFALRLASGRDGTELLVTRLQSSATGEPLWAGTAQGAASDAIGELPVEGRQWEVVEELSSAVHDATVADGGSAQNAAEGEDPVSSRAEAETGSSATGLSVAGTPSTQDAETVDGLSADQSFRAGPRGAAAGGPRLRSSFAESAIRSVRTMPQNVSAQYGGAGAAVAVTSREAESRLRGSVFVQARESAWAASNPFSQVTHYTDGAVSSVRVRPADSLLETGGTAGVPLRLPGALRRWRTGVFGSLEEQLRSQTLVSSPQTAGFYDLSATQRALLGNRGVSDAAVNAALDYLDGLTGAMAVRSPQTLGFARLDTAPAAHQRLSLTYQRARTTAPVTGGAGASDGVVDRAVSSIGASSVQVDAGTAQWQTALGPRASNGVRFQLAHDLEFETPQAAGADVPATGPGGYAPQVAIEPEGFVYGTPSSLGRVAYPDERRIEVADTLTVRAGRHLVSVGGDWSRVHDRVLAATNLEGSFLYDSGTTDGRAGGLVDWITDDTFNVHAYPNGGCPSITASVHYFCFRSYSQSFQNAPTEFVTHEVSGFAEDTVRAHPDLRVTLGVRYDYLLLPFPQTPNGSLDGALAGVVGAAAGVTSSFPEDRNNVGPRASIAWSPGEGRHGHWLTAEAGYGFFYGRLPGATIDAALANTAQPTAAESIRITPTTETECPQVANQGFGYPCSFPSAPPGVVARTGSAVVFARRFRLPAVQRGTFALDREIGGRLLLRAEYATAWSTQLPESTDLNIAPSTSTASYVLQGGDGRHGLRPGETFEVPLYTERQSALFGPVTSVVSNANATYHSATAEARLREWHGLSARGSYTFSRAIDYGPQSSPTPREDGQFDPFANGYDKGLSSLQFPQRFVGDLVYRSEMAGGSRELRAMVSGWQMAMIGSVGSGAPYSYGIFGGTELSGGHESINGSGGATYLPTVGRNTLRLPPRSKMDVRLSREIPVHGAMRVELRGEVFNALNTVSVSRVETRAFLLGTAASPGGPTPLVFQDAAAVASEGLSTPAFGTPLSSTSGLSRERQVELGARLHF